MFLSEYCERYILERDLEPTTEEQYRVSVSNFEKWHGRPIVIETELTADLLNAYLKSLKARGLSSHTRKGRRLQILVLWRAMKRDRRIDFHEDADYVMTVKAHELEPDCWDFEQVEILVKYAGRLRGTVRDTNVPAALYWPSFFLAAWDSAMRRGDLLRFDSATVRRIEQSKGGKIRLLQNKSKRMVDVHFHPETIEAMVECLEFVPRNSRFDVWPSWANPPQELPHDRLWPRWTLCYKPWHRELNKVVAGAGLPHGATKFLRRAAATDAEIDEAGAAAKKLGHSPNSQGLANAHYINPRLIPLRPVVGRQINR